VPTIRISSRCSSTASARHWRSEGDIGAEGQETTAAAGGEVTGRFARRNDNSRQASQILLFPIGGARYLSFRS
jgi:hypothetical protein